MLNYYNRDLFFQYIILIILTNFKFFINPIYNSYIHSNNNKIKKLQSAYCNNYTCVY